MSKQHLADDHDSFLPLRKDSFRKPSGTDGDPGNEPITFATVQALFLKSGKSPKDLRLNQELPRHLSLAHADDKPPVKLEEKSKPLSPEEQDKRALAKLAWNQRFDRDFKTSNKDSDLTTKEFDEYRRVGAGLAHGRISDDMAQKYRDTNFETDFRASKEFIWDFRKTLTSGRNAPEEWSKLVGENSPAGNFAKWLTYRQMFSLVFDNLKLGREDAEVRPLLAGILRDRAGPGNSARDLTEFCLRDAFMAMYLNINDGTIEILMDGLKQLTKPDKPGGKPPLSEEQRIIIMRLKLKRFADPTEILERRTPTADDLAANPQLALIRELAKAGDRGSIPVFHALLKNSPHASVKQACAMAISDFGPFPDKLWKDTIPDPTLTPDSRAKLVQDAFEMTELFTKTKYPPKFLRPGDVLGEQIAWAIADAYRLPAGIATITDKNDPGLKLLDRALDSEHLAARLAAAKVMAKSELGFDHPTKQKACQMLVNTILDGNMGTTAKKEAIALLDETLRGHAFVDVGKFQLGKTKDAIVAQDTFFMYTWTDDGKIEKRERERKIPVGDKFASIITGINTLGVKYTDESRIPGRIGTFDGDDLVKLQWTEPGKNGTVEFTATRKKEGDKYIDEWVVRVPHEPSGLSRDVPVKGKFELTKAGKYSYVGADWRKEEAGVVLRQGQEITGKGVTEYRDEP
jgi:hypothetical protein